MEQLKQTGLDKMLAVEFTGDDNLWLQRSASLRKLVGALGMALPLLLVLYLLISNGRTAPLESISHYFYTRAGTIFTVILSLLAIFLILYKSEERLDFYISLVAGVAALLVVLFPTSNLYSPCDVCSTAGAGPIVTYIENADLLPSLHYGAAAIFLGCLAYMSLFLFTKSNKSIQQRGTRKKIRNRIYRVCGVFMIAALLVMVLGLTEVIDPEVYYGNKLTFWMETLAVESFGVAWFIKGETLFKDKPKNNNHGT